MRDPDPAKVVRLLDCLLRSFGKHGQHWTRFAYDDGNGNRCLAGAVQYVECKHRSIGSGMTDYLVAAIWAGRERESRRKSYAGGAAAWLKVQDTIARFATFNDRCKGFERIRAVILKARALAQRDAERLPEIIAAAKALAAEKEEAAAAHKRQLLAELERERMMRHAKGDTAETYILCPRPPEPRGPERLAA